MYSLMCRVKPCRAENRVIITTRDHDPCADGPAVAWQPRSWRFMLLRTLKALPQPAWGHLKGFSPVWLWLWMRRLLGREKALLHVWQMYRSWDWGKAAALDALM